MRSKMNLWVVEGVLRGLGAFLCHFKPSEKSTIFNENDKFNIDCFKKV